MPNLLSACRIHSYEGGADKKSDFGAIHKPDYVKVSEEVYNKPRFSQAMSERCLGIVPQKTNDGAKQIAEVMIEIGKITHSKDELIKNYEGRIRELGAQNERILEDIRSKEKYISEEKEHKQRFLQRMAQLQNDESDWRNKAQAQGIALKARDVIIANLKKQLRHANGKNKKRNK